MRRAFPWNDAIVFGLGIMRLAPQAFWAMTPRELAAAMSVAHGAGTLAPSRRTLEDLLSAFPDSGTSELGPNHHG
ncbi:MAG: phage tail assembly chaperone [Roseitalea sp.]|jgi:uncharacterized phage protein (TIGR02216 family)|uniref:Phage tail assembly chaperone n=1 Tax=Oceaniradius stylonematis TaxID=2184161 RepID=A0A3A8ALT2_9HYPH|nr:rcc01693 family protein [Oceaniradius stylonematis]MBO6554602.1 phage tail assembly chaperone [Roseitalea sp.]MBO6953645.1 phage tail assembly chaperone [Rhizobiaceae bacterium]RNC93549.1 MAG: phage tail assembly chaperone [Oricola sp.]MBO6593926.1 phage tail assembly chaperone [Roseitalea sp.]MBO6601389.1 phage tail assembly chaperone [Roseitalea sp.]